MEIHRPKPWHGWREFMREYAVIFVGVLTALAFEQGVEWLHRRTEVREAREALRAEVAKNASAALFNREYERCLGAWSRRLAAWAEGGSPSVAGLDDPIPWIRPGTSAWDVVKVGAAAHMPLEERLGYSRFYNALDPIGPNIGLEASVWLRLVSVAANSSLSPADARRVLEDARQAQVMSLVQSRFSGAVLEQAKDLGVEPAPIQGASREALANFCSFVGIAPRFD